MLDLLVAWQRWIYDGIRSSIIEFDQSGDAWLLLGMISTGVVFGAIHALTPGHGKTILASYLAGSGKGFGRALSVSTVLAATHVLTAVLIAFFAAHLVERSFVGGGRAPALEFLSRFLLLGIGFWLLFRAIRVRKRADKHEGLGVALATGLVPCPLTLFVVVAALSRGVPEAGLVFAGSMLIGIAITLGLVAIATVVGRRALMKLATRRGGAIETLSRGLDIVAGLLIVVFASRDLLN